MKIDICDYHLAETGEHVLARYRVGIRRGIQLHVCSPHRAKYRSDIKGLSLEEAAHKLGEINGAALDRIDNQEKEAGLPA